MSKSVMEKQESKKGTAEIHLDGKVFSTTIIEGTEQERAFDITRLRQETGYVTLDSGYKNTGATQSAITFLDGEKGILRYRGYPIEQLANQSTFLEVSYLLIYGELPTRQTLTDFENSIKPYTMLREDMKRLFEGFPTNAHPMGILASAVCALSTFYPESWDYTRGEEAVNTTIHRLISKFPTIAAWAHRYSTGQPFVYPHNKLNYLENFLHMMFSTPAEDHDYEPDPVIISALDKLLILHADHEQNCSTSTVRIVGSSKANLYASISAGISALWGPLHGGANQAVIEMLENIKTDGGNLAKWVDKAKDKNDPFRMMGFGHRVYKNYDPRAAIIKKACDEVLQKLGIHDPVLDIAKELEAVALKDEYFVQKKLYPNVDFYSGIIQRAMGIPTEMFTVMFAMGRLPGWIAQWREMMERNEPIGRPRQIYVGPNERDYVPIAKR